MSRLQTTQVSALCTFWLLEIIPLCKIRISATAAVTQQTTFSPTYASISENSISGNRVSGNRVSRDRVSGNRIRGKRLMQGIGVQL